MNNIPRLTPKDLDEIDRLEKELATETDPEKRRAIEKRLNDLRLLKQK